MSNEYKDWLTDHYLEKGIHYAGKEIYKYANEVFFDHNKEDVEFRRSYGSNGAEQKVLGYIKTYFIDPYEYNEEE